MDRRMGEWVKHDGRGRDGLKYLGEPLANSLACSASNKGREERNGGWEACPVGDGGLGRKGRKRIGKWERRMGEVELNKKGRDSDLKQFGKSPGRLARGSERCEGWSRWA